MRGTDPSGTNTAAKKAARYIRVSRSDQNPNLQSDESEDLICRRGWQLGESFVDAGQSGTKAHRPALDRLLGAARRREFDILVVWRADRLFRSLKGMVTTLSELAALGVEFVSVTEPFDTTTPQGRLLLHLVAAFAEFERGILIERTLAGQAAARRRGARIGRPPKKLDEAKVWKMHRAGGSLRSIAREFQVSSTHIHNILHRPDASETTDLRPDNKVSDTVTLETPKEIVDQMGQSQR